MFSEDKFTGRGFQYLEFDDASNRGCSLQQSSAIRDYEDSWDRPGSSCIWLGINDPNPQIMKSDAQKIGLPLPPGEVSGWMPYPIPKEVSINTRMHLDRYQVKSLIEKLQLWLDTGNLKQGE